MNYLDYLACREDAQDIEEHPPDGRRMNRLACREDVQQHPHGDSDFQWQSEADQSSVHDEERVVSSGLLMNNVNPEERIVVVGYLHNKEIAEEQEVEVEVAEDQEEEVEVAEDQEEEVEVAEIEGFLAEQIDNTTTPPSVWLFYGEAGVLDH